MEVNQRRYRRVQRVVEQLESDSKDVPELTKQELRRLLTQRRTVIGPNGEEIRIPKHMAVNDIIKLIKEEHGLTTAEITGILVTLKHFENNPEFRGKVNRVVASGIESPLKIERPKLQDETQIETVKPEAIKLEEIVNPETSGIEQVEPKNNILPFERTEKQKPTYSRTIIYEDEYRQRNAQINQNTVNRFRAEAAAQRKKDEERNAQNKNLEKQLNEHYARENERRGRRRRAGLAVAMLLGAMYVTGVIVDIANMTKQAMTPGENLNPIQIQEDSGRKLFEVTSDTIATFTKDVTPLVYTSQNAQAQEQEGYQSFEYSIDTVSQGLKPNTNLSNALSKFSATSQTPVVVGEIDSYQDFETLLKSGDEALYISGPAYFANFSRQMLHGMLKDKYDASKVVATYEKKGENNQIYEFNIRYYKDGSSNPRTVEGRVDMTRNEEGRLQTKEYHTLPYEVYELLATIGEFSDFSNTEDGKVFDIEGYAAKFTNGDVERAKEELKERMDYGTEAMKSLIKNRIREEQVKSYLNYER